MSQSRGLQSTSLNILICLHYSWPWNTLPLSHFDLFQYHSSIKLSSICLFSSSILNLNIYDANIDPKLDPDQAEPDHLEHDQSKHNHLELDHGLFCVTVFLCTFVITLVQSLARSNITPNFQILGPSKVWFKCFKNPLYCPFDGHLLYFQ